MKIGKIICNMQEDVYIIKRNASEQIEKVLQEIFANYKLEVSNYDQTRVRFFHENGTYVDFILYATYDNDITTQSMPRIAPRLRYTKFEPVQFPINEIQDIKIKLNKLYE